LQRSLQVFEESIRSEVTKKHYKYDLAKYFKFTKARNYDSLTSVNQKESQIQVEDYIMHLKKRCRLGALSPNSVPILIAPVFMFYEQNDVILNKKKLKRMFPEREKTKGEKPYTTKEIQKMLKFVDVRTRALIHFMASTGGRPGILVDPVLRRKHISDMEEGIWCFTVYAGSKEEDCVLITPEANTALQEYFNYREFHGEKLTLESPIFRNKFLEAMAWSDIKPMSIGSASATLERVVIKAGLRKPSPERKHHEQALFGAFRKRYDTILKLSGAKPAIVEKLMCHRQTLDGKHYFKPTKEELVREFKKAIPDLVIEDSERDKLRIQKLEKETEGFEKKYAEIENQKQVIKTVEQRMADAEQAIQDILDGKFAEILKAKRPEIPVDPSLDKVDLR